MRSAIRPSRSNRNKISGAGAGRDIDRQSLFAGSRRGIGGRRPGHVHRGWRHGGHASPRQPDQRDKPDMASFPTTCAAMPVAARFALPEGATVFAHGCPTIAIARRTDGSCLDRADRARRSARQMMDAWRKVGTAKPSRPMCPTRIFARTGIAGPAGPAPLRWLALSTTPLALRSGPDISAASMP